MYTDYAHAVASTNDGIDEVVDVQLTLDSGWFSNQRANVSNVMVNDNKRVPKTTETTTTTTVDGAYIKTCALPAAELRWAKNDNTATGAVNEAESIQPKDTDGPVLPARWTPSTSTTSRSSRGTRRASRSWASRARSSRAIACTSPAAHRSERNSQVIEAEPGPPAKGSRLSEQAQTAPSSSATNKPSISASTARRPRSGSCGHTSSSIVARR